MAFSVRLAGEEVVEILYHDLIWIAKHHGLIVIFLRVLSGGWIFGLVEGEVDRHYFARKCATLLNIRFEFRSEYGNKIKGAAIDGEINILSTFILLWREGDETNKFLPWFANTLFDIFAKNTFADRTSSNQLEYKVLSPTEISRPTSRAYWRRR